MNHDAPVLNFAGGVTQGITALLDILDVNLRALSQDDVPDRISKATQILKHSVGRLQQEIEQSVHSRHLVAQFQGPPSSFPAARSSVASTRPSVASTFAAIPSSSPSRPSWHTPLPVEPTAQSAAAESCWHPICAAPSPLGAGAGGAGAAGAELPEWQGTEEAQEELPFDGIDNEDVGPYASDRHASDRPGGSRLAVVSHASSRSDKELPPIAERPTESSRVPGAWGKMPEPDEFEDLPEVENHLFNPNWTGKMTWDFAVMFLVVTDSIILPFQLSFKHGMPEDAFDEVWFWITTVVFFTDVLFSFNTAIENPSQPGTWILSRLRIAKNYLLGWFSIDFFSTIPYGRLAETFGDGSSAGAVRLLKMLKFLRIMRLMRMLRMSKLRAVWERLEIRIGSIAIIQSIMLMKVLFFVVAMCHWSACLFWVIGRPESLLTDLLPGDSAEKFQQMPHWTTLSRRDGPDQGEWSYEQKPLPEQYIFCFYWTLGVMRTMPAEVTPVNFPERIFVLLFMFFALSAFAVSVASLTQAYFKIFERGRTFNDELFFVRMYMNRFGAQKPLEQRVKKFLAHLFERRRIMAKETNLMEKLPEVLKHEVQSMLVWHHLQKLEILNDLGKGAIQEICAASTLSDHMPGVLLCTKGEVAEYAWILCSGQLQVLDEQGCRWRSMMGASRMTVVDQETLTTPETVKSPLTVSTATVCELLQISKATFLKFAGQDQAGATRIWRKKFQAANTGVIKVQFSGLETDEAQNTICASATTAVLMSGH
ncbi:unnamed protein product [Effrenium voratum]|nr:unnamed protein product [Effrenium voratum]